MSNKNAIFYRGNTSIHLDFSAEEISSDRSMLLLEKLVRNHRLIRYFSNFVPNNRIPSQITHSIEKLLKQRVFSLMPGYEDTNDVNYLKRPPVSGCFG